MKWPILGLFSTKYGSILPKFWPEVPFIRKRKSLKKSFNITCLELDIQGYLIHIMKFIMGLFLEYIMQFLKGLYVKDVMRNIVLIIILQKPELFYIVLHL